MKSLLIVPPRGWSTKDSLNMPPPGIAYIASMLEENDYEAQLLEEVSASSRFKVARNESGLTLFEKVR